MQTPLPTAEIIVEVPLELKEKMEKHKIDWNREIKEYLEERLRAHELLDLLDKIAERAEMRRVRADSAELIRESRYGQ